MCSEIEAGQLSCVRVSLLPEHEKRGAPNTGHHQSRWQYFKGGKQINFSKTRRNSRAKWESLTVGRLFIGPQSTLSYHLGASSSSLATTRPDGGLN